MPNTFIPHKESDIPVDEIERAASRIQKRRLVQEAIIRDIREYYALACGRDLIMEEDWDDLTRSIMNHLRKL